MDILILDSAYKHGITEESIYSCLFNVRGGKLLNDPPPKHLLAGFDHLGNAIELITIEEEDRNLLIVIHAMGLRKQNRYLLEGDL
jgi:uncharacterized protein (UPF0371 family)